MQLVRRILLVCLSAAIAAARSSPLAAQEGTQPAPFKPEQIDQLVAPIALYPDPLLAQVLMASTYPLEIVEAARWVKDNPNVKEDQLSDAMQKQSWDPSVKSLTAFPQVLDMMNTKLDWTQQLGDAFLAQQADVMEAVQRLRAKAKAEGNLETTKEQTVTVEQQPANVQQNVTVQQPQQQPAPPPQVITIQPANPQVVYVPTYNPTVVYGAWPYPAYPPYSYYPPGYVAATSMISFGVGLAVGSALWGGCNWGHNDVNVNVNNYNNFNKTNIANGNWQHNVDHRKGVQYRDQRTQQRYKGTATRDTASRDAFRGRAEQGRQQMATKGGAEQVRRDLSRSGAGGQAGNRPGAGTRPAAGAGGGNLAAGQRPGAQPRPATGQRQAGQARQMDVGARQPSAFKGVGNGAATRQDSSRGYASRQSASSFGGGGGGARGGGYSGGGARGGGGGGARGGGGRGGGGRGR